MVCGMPGDALRVCYIPEGCIDVPEGGVICQGVR